MFDEPTSLPMRAAMASLMGSLFGIAMILYTNAAHAQRAEPQPAAASAVDPVAVIKRLGDATLHSLRGSANVGTSGMRGLRIADAGAEPTTGLRWQTIPPRVLRSDVENPRAADQFGLGLNVRF